MTPVLLQVFGFSIADLLDGVVNYAFYIGLGLVITWIIFGWIGFPSSDFMQRVHDVVTSAVNPMIMPIRGRLPPLRLGGIALDLSPIILIIGLWMISRLLSIIIDLFVRPVTG